MDFSKRETGIFVGYALGILFLLFLIIGPNKINRFWQNYKADAYGSDWLVVQYDMTGSPIQYWELKDKSIGSEFNSDGIFFTDNDNLVIHLSGFYNYIEIKDNNFEKAKEKYLFSKKILE